MLASRLRSLADEAAGEHLIGGTHTRRFQDNLLPVMTLAQMAVLRGQLEAGAGGELNPTTTGKPSRTGRFQRVAEISGNSSRTGRKLDFSAVEPLSSRTGR
jgi:hypothetical protein